MMNIQPKKKMRFAKKVLLFMAFILCAFVAVMIWLFYLYQTVPDALVYSFFGLFTGELGVLGWIKQKE